MLVDDNVFNQKFGTWKLEREGHRVRAAGSGREALALVERERFDLVIPAAQAGSREVHALRKVLASPWLLTQLASLPGYDPSCCGDQVAAW